MSRRFSEKEKKNIKMNLLKQCERLWIETGYKKTSIESLCNSVGISKGAFYIFYDSKEELFCDVMDIVQNRMVKKMNEEIDKNPDKYGFMNGLKELFKEYERSNWIENMNSPEYLSFLNKLPEDRLIHHNDQSGLMILDEAIVKCNLKYKVPKEKIISIISSLIMILSGKNSVKYDADEVFDFLLECVIDRIFE